MIKLKDLVWGEIDYVDEETYNSSADEIQITRQVILMCCGGGGGCTSLVFPDPTIVGTPCR